jgi:hypothetical protein
MAKPHVAALTEAPAYSASAVVVVHNQIARVAADYALTQRPSNSNHMLLIWPHALQLSVSLPVLRAARTAPTIKAVCLFFVPRKKLKR